MKNSITAFLSVWNIGDPLIFSSHSKIRSGVTQIDIAIEISTYILEIS